NSWMQTPTGYTEINGQFQPTSWYHVIFNPAFVWRFPHQVLAVLISAAWFIAAIGAYYLLKNRAAEFACKTMSIGLLGASLLLPIQLYVGDSTASYVSAVYQPAKVTAAEGNFANGNTGWNLIVIPNQSKQKDDYTLSIPHAGSVFVFHNFSGTTPVPGLSLFPKSMQPPVWPTFYGFKVMIFAAWGMFSVAFIGLVMRLRRRMFTERWFLRLVLWTMPVGVFATIAGWVVSESGRQPWLVNGKLLVSNSPSSLSTGELIATLVGFWVVYLVLFGAWVRHVVREVRRGPEELPTTSADTPPASPPRPSTQLAPVLVPLGSE
ncbi:MAG: cytochrome bd ubiquinol oxidase subunit, partial [Actinoplanes sp.]|nr:cytochrome bd ubiquinol oxidase subunit [Actinoplanes sp.]